MTIAPFWRRSSVTGVSLSESSSTSYTLGRFKWWSCSSDPCATIGDTEAAGTDEEGVETDTTERLGEAEWRPGVLVPDMMGVTRSSDNLRFRSRPLWEPVE